MGGVSLEKKMGGGHSQTTSSTLGNSLAYSMGAGSSHAIRRLIKGGGYGTNVSHHLPVTTTCPPPFIEGYPDAFIAIAQRTDL